MALVQMPKMTEKNLAAHQQNGRQSRGAATPQGKERARAANLRHGYYSKINDEALTALGENPQELADLMAGAHEQWRPANPHQVWITERLARLQWKIDRADRMQENAMARPVQRAEKRRRQKALNAHYCYADVHGILSLLQSDTLRPDYYTPPGYFVNFSRAFRVNSGSRMEEIRHLLHRLRKPDGYVAFTGRLSAGATAHKGWKEVRELYEDGSPIPQPEIPIAQGEERDNLRAELHALTAAELEEVKLIWEDQLLPEADQPLTQQDRDDLAADTYKTTELMRRQEHSCFREYFRLGSLLLKLQANESTEERAKPENRPCDMPQGDSGGETRAVEPEQAGDGASCTPAMRKNEGASGDVDENKGSEESQGPDFRRQAPGEIVETRGGRAEIAALQANL